MKTTVSARRRIAALTLLIAAASPARPERFGTGFKPSCPLCPPYFPKAAFSVCNVPFSAEGPPTLM